MASGRKSSEVYHDDALINIHEASCDLLNSGDTTFRHEPLQTTTGIRLLQLPSGIGEDNQLVCTPYDLRDTPSYYGISYCWGLAANHAKVRCNGQMLPISPDLLELLEYLDNFKREQDVNHFWIDQICIDQTNLDERSDQVQLMRHIYAKAHRTLIWLGPLDVNGDLVMLHILDHVTNLRESIPYDRGNMTHVTEEQNAELGLPDLDSADWKAFQQFLKKPWFRRVWVIQEVALCKHPPIIMLGNMTCSWHQFAESIEWLYRKGYRDFTELGALGQTIFTIQRIRHRKDKQTGIPKQWHLEHLLYFISDKEATDPRDCIYALLGLSIDVSNPNTKISEALVPSYRRPMFQVFTDIVRYCIRKSGSLLILGVGGIEQRPEGTTATTCNPPSWMPRWDLPHQQFRKGIHHSFDLSVGPDDLTDVRPVTRFQAAQDLQAQMLHNEDIGALCLKGIKVDHIVWCSESTATMSDNPKALHPLTDIWEGVLAHMGLEKTGDGNPQFHSVAEAIYMSMIAGEVVDRQANDELMQDFWLYLSHLYAVLAWETENDEAYEKYALLWDVYRKLGEDGVVLRVPCRLSKRRMFITSRGFIGMSSISLCKGDEVFVLFGSDVPHVLRNDREGNHLLVGEAYVHGLMHGEVITQWRDGLLNETLVTLR